MAQSLLGKNIALLCRRGAGAVAQLEAALSVLLQQNGGGFAPVSLQADYDRSLTTRIHHEHGGKALVQPAADADDSDRACMPAMGRRPPWVDGRHKARYHAMYDFGGCRRMFAQLGSVRWKTTPSPPVPCHHRCPRSCTALPDIAVLRMACCMLHRAGSNVQIQAALVWRICVRCESAEHRVLVCAALCARQLGGSRTV